MTLLDLLEAHPAAELSLYALVELSAPIAPRFYSIASSPFVSPDTADLIVGTMAAPAWSGLGEHRGFASSYMQEVARATTSSATSAAPTRPSRRPLIRPCR